MIIKALVSFSGAIAMAKGEEREYGNKAVLSDLLQAGYVKEVIEEPKQEEPKPERPKRKKKVGADEGK